ncbi:Mth938-like domain-containing protein [Roseibium aestuarii]|uniref:Mth938-like domain-containing protein n=1 Tax=Roseibium aestuarii TaxID=2600299 RepID=A0ABW4JT35_9HYPH|nr:Mth938-like domain-containing protein [Roseibium aestuarii]
MVEIRKAHFPGRAPLDAYGNGGFRFAGMSHLGSLLCVPSGIYGWAPSSFADLTPEAFEKVFEEVAGIEVLLIGTGADLRPIPAALKTLFREAGIISDTMSTGAAVRTFNVMLAEERAVAAALLAVDYER